MSCTRCHQLLEETSNRPPEREPAPFLPRRPRRQPSPVDSEEGARQASPGPASGEEGVLGLKNMWGLEFWDLPLARALDVTVP